MANDKATTAETTKPSEAKQDAAPAVPLETGKTADAAPATEEVSAKEQAARAAVLSKAEKDNAKLADKIATEWAKIDRTMKTWMVDNGERCHQYLAAAVGIGVPYREAMSNLRARVKTATGEDKATDITRCVQTYFAAVALGRDDFAKLPIRGQKEFATTFVRKTDDATETEVYFLKPEWAQLVKDALAYSLAKPAKETREWMERGKDGVLTGDAIGTLVKEIRDGKNPLKEAPAAAPTEGSKDATTQPPAGGKKKGKTEDATGERTEPTGAPKLDVKPAIAAAQLIPVIVEHDEPRPIMEALGKAPEFKAEYVESIIRGMGERNRIEDLRRIVAAAGRELRILHTMESKKCGRAEAETAVEQMDVRRAG